MEEIIRVVQDLGIYACIMIILLYLGFKYIPKYIEMKLKKSEEKDVLLDSVKSVIDNNTRVIDNNTEVIALNSKTIKDYTNNSHKLEHKIDVLSKDVQNLVDVEMMKERR